MLNKKWIKEQLNKKALMMIPHRKSQESLLVCQVKENKEDKMGINQIMIAKKN